MTAIKATHTPGPWRSIERDGYDGVSIIGANSYDVALVKRLVGMNADQTHANSQLIAAAPELLAACKAALRDISYLEREQVKGVCTTLDSPDMLRAAIAKAEAQE